MAMIAMGAERTLGSEFATLSSHGKSVCVCGVWEVVNSQDCEIIIRRFLACPDDVVLRICDCKYNLLD